MSACEETQKKKRGRPQYLTLSAKKRKKTELDSKWNKTRINIGAEFHRWNTMKQNMQLKTHAELAKFLLDSYEKLEEYRATQNTSTSLTQPDTNDGKDERQEQHATTSTPATTKTRFDRVPDLSGISSSESYEGESDVSGVRMIHSSEDGLGAISQKKDRSSSFLDSFSLTIGVSEEDSYESADGSDEDYEPSINITIGPANADELEEVLFKETEFSQEEDSDEAEEVETSEVIPGVLRILSTDDQHLLTDDETYMVYATPLLTLARLKIHDSCSMQGCCQPVELKHESIGSALYIKWICKGGHLLNTWCSQPILNRRLHGGDLLLSASVLLSGNNYSKIALFAKFLRLHFVSPSVFLRIQRTYLVPTIDDFWEDKQSALLDSLHNEPLVVLGDGRMDSPGHCAQCCSYTMMDNASKSILSLVTLDKRQTAGKSSNLEKAAFIKTITSLE